MMNGPDSLASRLDAILAPRVRSLGYELLDLEYQAKGVSGGPVLRLFIENLSGSPILFEDCVKVDHGLDELLASPEFEQVLAATFTLEVSSPGLDRPLKKRSDFERFTGRKAQVKTFRAVTLEEMENAKYFEHHQKQKNFSGILRGLTEDSLKLETDNMIFQIPLALITKANLDIEDQLAVGDTNEQQEETIS